MEISIKRDGLTLRGDIYKPEGKDRFPIFILFHGFMGTRGKADEKDNTFTTLTDAVVASGVGVVKFDFDGHGDSDGEFCDMNIYSEILDAAKIIDYVRALPFCSDIYVGGHSQGALVSGMMAGYYREFISKLVLLSPAATIKDDAQHANCFGVPYDYEHVPERFPTTDIHGKHYEVGGLYFRIARTLPIYETTSMFRGKTLIIHGDSDPVAGVIGARRYAECMHNVTLNLVPGEGHGLCDKPDTWQKSVIEPVVAFLSE
ncbi:MAG: alpha/beta hydrolase [Treponema sp.]|nr:alpha/beta hydrolase [Treponema sp.]